jgi:putative Ca2+/H+ antiporter (TMEM165/GDT1 family)
MACSLIAETSQWLSEAWLELDWLQSAKAAAVSFGLVAVAEFGDKSQWVCMALAARHRHWPVLLGATLAFALLNALGVLFGAAAAGWLPERVVALAVALLFAFFGIRSLLAKDDDEQTEETVVEKSGHGVVATTFLMIFLAELGDKTQFAVAGLGAAEPALPVWLGATLALVTTSAMGIWVGKALVGRVSPRAMSIAGGILFLLFALVAALKAIPPEFLATLSELIRVGT